MLVAGINLTNAPQQTNKNKEHKMSKQISKDNREYWQNKLSSKFREKKQTIESLHQIEINEQSQKNYPIFKKRNFHYKNWKSKYKYD